MKIFISHSSKDKWIAQRISADLEAMGATTFLDAKDIRTGESIDDSIQAHLRESDEVVLLVSPESLASSWVLIEVGGAKALGLRLIPILLHVGVNDVPAPLSKGLARDLNDIEAYYSEVKARLGKGAAKPAKPRPRRRPRSQSSGPRAKPPTEISFSQGDRVMVLSPKEHRAERIEIAWKEEMDKFVGEQGTVMDVDDDRSVQLDIDGERWWWAFDWLAHAPATS